MPYFVLKLRTFEERYFIDISGITTPFHSLPRTIHGNVDVEALRSEEANDPQAPGGFSGIDLSIRFEVSTVGVSLQLQLEGYTYKMELELELDRWGVIAWNGELESGGVK